MNFSSHARVNLRTIRAAEPLNLGNQHWFSRTLFRQSSAALRIEKVWRVQGSSLILTKKNTVQPSVIIFRTSNVCLESAKRTPSHSLRSLFSIISYPGKVCFCCRYSFFFWGVTLFLLRNDLTFKIILIWTSCGHWEQDDSGWRVAPAEVATTAAHPRR